MNYPSNVDVLSLAYHQLKNHLTAVRGFCQLLTLRIGGELTEKQESYILQILQHTDEMLEETDNFLQAARIGGKEFTLASEEFDPREMVNAVIANLSFFAKARNAEIIPQFLFDSSVRISTSRVALIQILSNLISNSCKYHRGKVRIDVMVEWRRDDIVFTVRDDGIGIRKEDKERIFQKFFRSKEAMLIDAKGYGLGLHVTQSLVKALGGTITFDTAVGEGTTFRVTIPLAR